MPSTDNQHLYRTFFRLTLPLMLQQLLVALINFLDIMMITRLGVLPVAGVGLANQVYYLFIMINFGLFSGIGVLLAQFWGKQDLPNFHRSLGLGLSLGMGAAVIIAIFSILLPAQLLSLLTQDSAAVASGTKYLMITAFSYPFTALSFGLGSALRSIGKPVSALISALTALSLNAGLNYILIFGKLGMPMLGVEGAAIGTLVARVVEAGLLLFLVRWKFPQLLAKLDQLLNFSKTMVRHVFRVCAPVLVNEIFWALGMIVYVVAYGLVSTEALAVSQVAGMVQNLFAIIGISMGNAAAVFIGQGIGRGDLEQVKDFARRFMRISLVSGIITAVVMYYSIPLIIKILEPDQLIVESLRLTLMVFAVLFPVKTMGCVLIIGVFRGGGNTRYAMLLELACVWLLGVPLAFIGAQLLQLPIHWLILLINAEEILKVIIGLVHMRKRKWIRDITTVVA